MKVHNTAAAWMPTVTGSRASASPSAAPMDGASEGAAGGVTQADFTQMTRQSLFDWMNTRIKSGELSLDDTSGLLGMTMKMAVDGRSTGLDDQAPVNFMQLAQDGIHWGTQHHEEAQVQALQKALDIMRRHQGEPVRVNLTA